ncbi:MAG: hypothetical protein COZ06_28580 [Armatimonadetes bacterium CG_4_10_14_3_um_filter_66_18]|nr:hypothetical protein [Armatimonadota bacterium]OIO93820.1 MAG: hypothetical protein AUJ96_29665 [Armatimonadetes bacterium CG2_30_66_41]PIU92758.1 MAG: hypothetical protein COS65_16025 [Armatimonadetes bacterium CG06_land_8_20_14_3_00_66_21]PIX44735.1 MAG: hypothetical protein COZ57_16960 [Armatimonadetes bacterium CG_4_8_14_3_um_filter_66_20]PIY40113.1 MAG: hypothetical protein COZ06_28580 [Armatimonadetes bacterium CG_4_10_14_3_um_filter_66_18]PIZ41715.1 MAG: hypothetical protein COY42_18
MSKTVAIPPDYVADMKWASEHTQELHDTYENKWIAIVHQQVVAAGADLGPVRTQAARRTGRPRDQIYVDFMDDGLTIYAQDPPPIRDAEACQ